MKNWENGGGGGGGALHPAVLDCSAHACFVSIDLSSIDMSIANLESVQATLIRLLAIGSLVHP